MNRSLRDLKKLWNDTPIGFKLIVTFVPIILITMMLIAFTSYRIINKHIISDSHEKLNISLRTAWIEYYEFGNQMRYGMMQASSMDWMKDGIKRGDRQKTRRDLRNMKETRPYIHFGAVVDKNRRVIARLNSDLNGDTFEVNNLVKEVISSGEQQMSTETLTEEILKREMSGNWRDFAIPIVTGTSKDEYKKNGKGDESKAMSLMVVTPVYGKNQDVIGAIIAGMILNNDRHIPGDMTDIMQGVHTTISMDGLRIATNLIDSNNRLATGTLLPDSAMKVIKSGKPVQGEWNVLGQRYISVFDPITDHRGRVIGSIDVSIPLSSLLATQRENQIAIALITFLGLALSLMAALIATHKITRPLKLMKDKASAFAKGDMEARVEFRGSENTRDEVGILARTFNAMTEEIKGKFDAERLHKNELEDKNRDLSILNERLKETKEELEVSYEELQSQTEEVQATNEELRLLNEDMERKNTEILVANRIIKQEEEELRSVKNKLRLIYDSIRDYILLTDRDLRVIEANRCFTESLRPGEFPVIGKTLCHLLNIQDPSRDCPAKIKGCDCPVKESIRTRTPVETEMVIDGKILQWHSFPLLSEGKESEMSVVYIKDVTEQRLLMQRLTQADKLSSLGELISGVAHELNNPLTAIMGFSELLLMGDMHEQVKTKAQNINDASQRCKRIVDNLLSFARMQKLDRRYQDVNGVIASAFELKAYQLRVDNIEVAFDLDSSLPKTIIDGHQLQQVFLNLLNNAQHAIKEKGEAGKITIKTISENGKIYIRVSDTGAGIPNNIIARIFDPFFTTKDVGVGTGLGLSISYGIIREHGGDIRVMSRSGEGTTFAIELPVIEMPDKAQPATLTEQQDTLRVSGLRALVLDDEPVILDFLKEVLFDAGFHVEATNNGQRALEMLKEADYNIIISDMKMPGMDGKQFYNEIKSIKPEAARKIIFISGDISSSETQDFIKNTGNPCLLKPFTINQIKEIIAEFIP